MQRLAVRAAALVVLALPGLGWAAESLRLKLADLDAEGWSARGVQASLDLRPDGPVRITIAHLALPDPIGAVAGLSVHCAKPEVSAAAIGCESGRYRLTHPWLDAGEFSGRLRLDRDSGRLAFAFRGVPMAGSRLDLAGHWQDGAWSIDARGQSLDLARIKSVAEVFAPAAKAYSVAGKTALRAKVSGDPRGLRAEFEADVSELALADESGALASEGLALVLKGKLRGGGENWAFDLDARSPRGQLYVEPVFVDSGKHPFELDLSGDWRHGALRLERARLRQPGALQAQASLRYAPGKGLDALDLRVDQAQLAGLYGVYLQPFLIGTPLDSLETAGSISGSVRIEAGEPKRIALDLSEAALDDKNGRFGLTGLTGNLRWSAADAGAAEPMQLRWRDGHLHGVGLGAAALALKLQGRDVELLAPVRIPVLDGALEINTLRVRRAGEPEMSAAFDARLLPIDMRRFSKALGWPEFAGKLAGKLPSLTYEDGRLSVGGRLEVEAFHGRIAVDDLQLRDPFGRVPRLSANLHLRDLDLKSLTETFSFGRIEGRLSGDVENLRLVNWKPAAFDARFYTPPGDDSRHRISQRAINNISSIGGGGAAQVLSRSFLRFFEDFSYDRIGISCRLEEDVCRMGGLGPARDGNGYYIVRGRFLPRVDVIGYQREVDWSTLVEQLKSVTESEGPVIR